MIYPCMSMLLFIYLLKDIWSTFKFSYTPHAETPKEYSCTYFCVFRWKCFINVSEKLNFDLCYHKTIQKTDIMGFLFLCTFGSWKTSPLSSWVPSSTPRSPSRCRLDCTPYFLLVLGDSIFSKLDGDKKKKMYSLIHPKMNWAQCYREAEALEMDKKQYLPQSLSWSLESRWSRTKMFLR